MISGGPIKPAKATAAPAAPPKREPKTTEKLTTLGPGRNCDSAKASLNSSAVIQPFCSTILRRAQGKAPPKPETETIAKARNSSERDGRAVTEDEEGVAGADMHLRITSQRVPPLGGRLHTTLARPPQDANDWVEREVHHASAGLSHLVGRRGSVPALAAVGTGAIELPRSSDHTHRSLCTRRRQRCHGAGGGRTHEQVAGPDDRN